jgi:hypothetical protein
MQACGEERWAEIPNTFVKRFQSIIRSLPMDTLAAQNMKSPPEAPTRSDLTPHNASEKRQISNQISGQGHNGKQPGGSRFNPPLHRRPSGLKADIVDLDITQHRVLFLAKQGGDYKLAQIRVTNANCHTFFRTMKKEYYRLRGLLRGWFSVWRYSHCDFYKASALIRLFGDVY